MENRKELELFRMYFKLPFVLDDWCSYVFDATGHQMVLQFSPDFDGNGFDEDKQEIVNVINGKEKTIKLNHFTAKGEDIFADGKYFMCARGWGYLTGQGSLSLSNERAIEIQDSLINYILERLNA